MAEAMKVLFLASEAVPFAKTGGLADVAGALPPALRGIGLDVRLVLPLYNTVRSGDFGIRPLEGDVEIPMGSQRLRAGIGECQTGEGVPVYFVEREDLFDRPRLYGNEKGDYYDNFERFAFFSKAALKIAERVSFKPDIIHCHDWQTGLVPCIAREASAPASYAAIPTVFTIHNLGYQGLFPEEKMPLANLRKEDFFHPEGLEYWGQISLLKAGINYSDAITTVSPTYAGEIQTREYGMGMEGIIKKRNAVLHGILNGIDYGQWDPAGDKHIPAGYKPGALGGKALCKASLLKEMGLAEALKDRPLLAMVSRLDNQKGLDLVLETVERVLGLDVGVAVLGSGSEEIQKALEDISGKNPGRFGLRLGFDEPLAHRLMAGADMLLIPSRYEPCGLTQMYALKYGTVPIVRATGGLEDSVAPFSPKKGTGTGFKFRAYTGRSLFSAIKKAVDLFRDNRAWTRLMENGMKMDYSWKRSARAYSELYLSVAGAGKEKTGEDR
jgi:starch synthase